MGQGLGGGPRASVVGEVGGRGTGPRDGANFATCVVLALFEGCPVGWGGVPTGAGLDGGRPRVLVAGEGWRGRRGWMAVPKKGEGRGLVGCSKEGQVQGRVGLLGSFIGEGKG